jgi:hypothetical protein
MLFNLFLGGALGAAFASATLCFFLGLEIWHGVVLWWLIESALMLGGLAFLAAEGKLDFANLFARRPVLQEKPALRHPGLRLNR